MSELDVSNASSEVARGGVWRGRRMCGVALALAGCVGLLPQPAPSADLSTIRLPPGFSIGLFAHDLGYPRFLTLDPRGTLLVSVPRAGRVIALPDDDRDGRADAVLPVLEGLELPHGLAFLDGQLYVAETGRVVRFDYDPATRRIRGAPTVIVPDLPARGTHWTRTIVIGPDRRLYVSVGSSCNSCEERDRHRAAIYRYDADGRGGAPFATGLRNAVGIAFRPSTPELWATVNGRDWLGDDRPGEYVTRVEEGAFYGWPYCHWAPTGLVPDPDLGGGDRCKAARRPDLLYQAHTAPLGLAFYTGSQFPPEYRGDLLVALHGSWNRAVPVGYKVIRVRFGASAPVAEDFATGWLVRGRSWGRPVDLAVAPDGALFLSDDGLGAVYRIVYRGG
ncbi:MAG TPA: PQQ-dependent sugar dehydrogenase [Methylomirabilota bacterium]